MLIDPLLEGLLEEERKNEPHIFLGDLESKF
jgi:hypothetical protein